MKMISIILLAGLVIFSVYFFAVNRNSRNMTMRQKFLKAVYPFFLWMSKKKVGGTHVLTGNGIPSQPFYALKGSLGNGTEFNFDQLKGKKVLLVNSASDCGYTDQYAGLVKLQERNRSTLLVIAFPSNEFGGQEKEDDSSIEKFCKINYDVNFPLMKKSIVTKAPGQNQVFQWLTDKNSNGWNSRQPAWNFCKYLVDENGNLTHFFDPTVDPMGKEIREAVGDNH